MPNWVSNNIRIKGRENVIHKLVKDLHTDENQKFDFESIIPMPDTLRITSGGDDVIAMRYALEKKPINERLRIATILKDTKLSFYKSYFNKIYNTSIDYKERLESALKRFETKGSDCFDTTKYDELGIHTFEDFGNVYLNNIIQYGTDTWYDWSCINWGTKWNCRFMNRDYSMGDTEVYYDIDTAWSYPEPIIMKILENYDIDEIEVWYCDEDAFGGNCNHITYMNDNEGVHIIEHEDSNETIAKFIFGDDIVDIYAEELNE